MLRLHDGKNDTISNVAASKIPLYGFCGIAGPESFKITLAEYGMKLTGFKEFPDHHNYTPANIRSLIADAKTSGAEGLITTEKDLVKLRRIFPQDVTLLAQPVQLCLNENCGVI